jgi:hypothetical protein
MKISIKFLILIIFCINGQSKILFSQTTVHLSIIEDGRGILRTRGNECFVIGPYHLVEGAEARTVTITGNKQKISTGKFIKQFPGDIAIIKIETGAEQECQNFSVTKNYADILEKAFEGYLEIRNEDGSIDQEVVNLKKKSAEGITIQSKDSHFEFAKGMSGSSLFTNVNGVKTYLGMLLSVDESNTKYGNVFQADDMNRIMEEFFENPTSLTKSTTVQSGNIIKNVEQEGFKFDLLSAKKSGNRVVLYFNITSLNNDGSLKISKNDARYYDINGGFADATSLKLSGKNDVGGYVGRDFIYPKGVAIPFEISFENVPESNIIALIDVPIKVLKNSTVKFRNIEIEGANSYVRNITNILKSDEIEGFKFDLLSAKKSGNRVVLYFNITSLNNDGSLKISKNDARYYDINGGFADATSLKLSGKNDVGGYVGRDFIYPKGVAIPFEISFENVPESNIIALIDVPIKVLKNSTVKFRNIEIEGANSYVRNITNILKSDEFEGFKFELISAKKIDTRVVLNFQVTSLYIDGKLFLSKKETRYYDNNGGFSDATSLKLSGKNDIGGFVGRDFIYPKGVAIPFEITFENVPDSNSISLLEIKLKAKEYTSIQLKDIPLN